MLQERQAGGSTAAPSVDVVGTAGTIPSSFWGYLLVSCREREFLEAMQQRFLAGDDPGIDYAAIDRDEELDHHWADERSRDAEERYFES